MLELNNIESVIERNMEQIDTINVERVIPFRKYSGYEIASILKNLPTWVAKGESPSTLLLGEWFPKTLSLPYSQNISDVNLDFCKKNKVNVVYVPGGGRAFLNTGKELYFLLVARYDGNINTTKQYKQIANGIINTLNEFNIPAYLDARKFIKNGVEISDGHDIKIGECNSYWTNKVAVLAGNSSRVELSQNLFSYWFLRHGSIFVEPYTYEDFDFMLKVMNTPDSIPRKRALDVMNNFAICTKSYNPNLDKEKLAHSIGGKFGEFGDWFYNEWSQIKEEAEESESSSLEYNPNYFRQFHKSNTNKKGLCLLPWGFLPEWDVGAYDVNSL